MNFYWYFLVLFAALLPAVYQHFRHGRKKQPQLASDEYLNNSKESKTQGKDEIDSTRTQKYRDFYFQLQNLEDYPEVLEAARDELLSMFSRGIAFAQSCPQETIFSIQRYDENGLQKFIDAEHERVMTEWADYLERRKQGCGPELFSTLESARAWLVQQAPVKLVDGAWLGHVHKITTPFPLREVTKHAWQVLSEELGDGDLSKNHVSLYRQILEDVGAFLPQGHSREFVDSHHWDDLDNQHAWQAAVGQLLISLFPHEFLPEILGFNMHYELITLDTMRAASELKSLGIDPNYFFIHVAIDNGDSGHAAMATQTVMRYLDILRSTEDKTSLDKVWKRIQVGYIMSQALGMHEQRVLTPAVPSPAQEHMKASKNPLNNRISEIFKAKALVSHKCHLQSRARIGGRSLSDWLAPSIWANPDPSQERILLMELSKAKPWIFAGDSRRSVLVRELQWNGRMFGAFTQDEVVALTQWIDSLGTNNDSFLYWEYTGREPPVSKDLRTELHDPAKHHPVVSCQDIGKAEIQNSMKCLDDLGPISESEWTGSQQLMLLSHARLPDLVGLWFAHIGLLENTVNTPSRTSSPLYAGILRALRAQAGFATETDVVAGIDEMRRSSCLSLVDVGLELLSRTGWAVEAKPACLEDVFILTKKHGQCDESVGLAKDMLLWSTRPGANLGWLMGMALAFLPVKEAVAKSPEMISGETSLVLGGIVQRERRNLLECIHWLEDHDSSQYRQLCQGYQFGKVTLMKCL